ncbi:MAG: hypothetical protein LBQ94_10825 [Treponema sp.]|jgi:hypothetical protein|nr:hypothetical protein [Treponema sp.]
MKAKILFFVLPAVMFAFGMAMVSCDTGPDPITGGGGNQSGNAGVGGTLTVTGIPAEYNGRYALFEANSGNVTYIRGYESVDESAQTTTLPQITNGRVSIPLWLWKNDVAGNSFYCESGYSGNDSVSQGDWYLNFAILGSGVLSPLSLPSILARIEFASITFSSGSAAISAAIGSLEIVR